MSTYQVDDEQNGIIRVSVDAGLVRRPFAETLCAEVERVSAGYPKRALILMDMGALSKATPAAALYTMRRMKELDFFAIGLFRANKFMQGLARIVMRLARFPTFGLFEGEAAARAWLDRLAGSPTPR